MPSLIPGYEYDIFISYRQKDNLYDGWVTGFVEHLKMELAATFKEEVSIYLDTNPGDGLLETHDVDATLRDKLKCLILIPIISRTYCDPNSFAWEYEFKAFIRLASLDRFGLKVRLLNGNVINRVLPVIIHNIDPGDRKLAENEMGGMLRGVEFIYTEPGVNRPLLVSEDHPDNNLSKTVYRNQINKVANAIEEIIEGLRNPRPDSGDNLREMTGTGNAYKKDPQKSILMWSLILLSFIMAGYIIFSIIFSSAKEPGKSVAVLPFHNYSEIPNQEWMSDALTNEIINHLYKVSSFDKVASLNSVLTYKDSNKKITQIAGELKVNYILEGTFQKIGERVRVTVHLIEPKTDKYLWQREYDQPYREIISIQSDIALQIAGQLKAFLTLQEKNNIQKIPTTNPEAYDLLQQAVIYFSTHRTDIAGMQSIIFKVLEKDPNYADAYVWAGVISLMKGLFLGMTDIKTAIDESLPSIEKALAIDPSNGKAHQVMGLISEFGRWDYVKAEDEYETFRRLDPKVGSPEILLPIGEFYLKMNKPATAIRFLKETLETEDFSCNTVLVKSHILSGRSQAAYDTIHRSLEPHRDKTYIWLGESYLWLQNFDSARIYFDYGARAGDLNMSFPKYQAYMALILNKTKNSDQARRIINKLISRSGQSSAGSPEYFIGWYYSGIGNADSAIFWLEKAYKTHSPEFSALKVDPVFRNIRKDPRYIDLYARTGHKAYDDHEAGKTMDIVKP